MCSLFLLILARVTCTAAVSRTVPVAFVAAGQAHNCFTVCSLHVLLLASFPACQFLFLLEMTFSVSSASHVLCHHRDGNAVAAAAAAAAAAASNIDTDDTYHHSFLKHFL